MKTRLIRIGNSRPRTGWADAARGGRHLCHAHAVTVELHLRQGTAGNIAAPSAPHTATVGSNLSVIV